MCVPFAADDGSRVPTTATLRRMHKVPPSPVIEQFDGMACIAQLCRVLGGTVDTHAETVDDQASCSFSKTECAVRNASFWGTKSEGIAPRFCANFSAINLKLALVSCHNALVCAQLEKRRDRAAPVAVGRQLKLHGSSLNLLTGDYGLGRASSGEASRVPVLSDERHAGRLANLLLNGPLPSGPSDEILQQIMDAVRERLQADLILLRKFLQFFVIFDIELENVLKDHVMGHEQFSRKSVGFDFNRIDCQRGTLVAPVHAKRAVDVNVLASCVNKDARIRAQS